MRILCINYEYPPVGGGGATVCRQLAEALSAAGHHIDVVTSAMRGLRRFEIQNGVRIHRVPCIRLSRYHTTSPELATQILPTITRARALCKQGDYDLIHCHFILPSGFAAQRVSRATGIPYVLTAHGSDVPGYNPERFSLLHRLLAPVWRGIVREAAAVTAPTAFLAGLIKAEVERPVEVIPNGFHYQGPGAGERRRRILMVARLVPRKGAEILIQAMAGLDLPHEVIIAGDGPYLNELKALAERKGVAVSFPGMVARDTLADLYRSAEIFVLPSLRENFPMVLLEAMAAGCAVVTSDAEGCVETVGDAAMITAAGKPAALARAIKRLSDHPQLRQALAARALRRAREFDIPVITDRYLALFSRLCSSATDPQ